MRLLDEVLGGESLTEREIEVLQLAAEGLSAEQSGEKMGLSPETIKTYRRRTLAKLEARNTANAIAIGFRTGVIR